MSLKNGEVLHTEYYDRLRVRPDVSAADLKQAYRTLILQVHPDKPNGNQDRFRLVHEAYEVLKEPKRRRLYDRFGPRPPFAAVAPGQERADMARPSGTFSTPPGADMHAADSGGGCSRSVRVQKGADVARMLQVGLNDMYTGKTIRLILHRRVFAQPSGPCLACGGRGELMVSFRTREGTTSHMSRACVECKGCGVRPGRARHKRAYTLDVEVPRGSTTGTKIRFPGMGDEWDGGVPGDVIIELKQRPHPTFERKGDDLIVRHTLSLRDALCGYSFAIVHLDTRVLSVQSRAGEVVWPICAFADHRPLVRCIPSEGMVIPNATGLRRGRLFILFHVQFPESGTFDANAIAQLKQLLPDPFHTSRYEVTDTAARHVPEDVALDELGKYEYASAPSARRRMYVEEDDRYVASPDAGSGGGCAPS